MRTLAKLVSLTVFSTLFSQVVFAACPIGSYNAHGYHQNAYQNGYQTDFNQQPAYQQGYQQDAYYQQGYQTTQPYQQSYYQPGFQQGYQATYQPAYQYRSEIYRSEPALRGEIYQSDLPRSNIPTQGYSSTYYDTDFNQGFNTPSANFNQGVNYNPNLRNDMNPGFRR